MRRLKNPSQCSHFKGVHEGAEKILPITKLINVNFLLPTMIIIIIAFILLLKLKWSGIYRFEIYIEYLDNFLVGFFPKSYIHKEDIVVHLGLAFRNYSLHEALLSDPDLLCPSLNKFWFFDSKQYLPIARKFLHRMYSFEKNVQSSLRSS